MKSILSLVAFVFNLNAHAVTSPSERIERAVAELTPLAASGVEVFQVKPGQSVKASLLELAMKDGYIDKESEFAWEEGSDKWGADTMSWGEATMKEAYSYITANDDSVEDEDRIPEEVLAKGKASFKLLLGTGVKFGVAPKGAVQCGVTFAALAIIDPQTGKIYLFSKEGSGC